MTSRRIVVTQKNERAPVEHARSLIDKVQFVVDCLFISFASSLKHLELFRILSFHLKKVIQDTRQSSLK